MALQHILTIGLNRIGDILLTPVAPPKVLAHQAENFRKVNMGLIMTYRNAGCFLRLGADFFKERYTIDNLKM